jgi:hypothetical protein
VKPELSSRLRHVVCLLLCAMRCKPV